MKRLILGSAAAAALLIAAPAGAQVYLGADPGGAGVRVGPFSAGVGTPYSYREPDCRIVRERIVTPDGRVVFRSQRVCD